MHNASSATAKPREKKCQVNDVSYKTKIFTCRFMPLSDSARARLYLLEDLKTLGGILFLNQRFLFNIANLSMLNIHRRSQRVKPSRRWIKQRRTKFLTGPDAACHFLRTTDWDQIRSRALTKLVEFLKEKNQAPKEKKS